MKIDEMPEKDLDEDEEWMEVRQRFLSEFKDFMNACLEYGYTPQDETKKVIDEVLSHDPEEDEHPGWEGKRLTCGSSVLSAE